jgi:hypothetical protein
MTIFSKPKCSVFILLCSQATNYHPLWYKFQHSVLWFDSRLLTIPILHSLPLRHISTRPCITVLYLLYTQKGFLSVVSRIREFHHCPLPFLQNQRRHSSKYFDAIHHTKLFAAKNLLSLPLCVGTITTGHFRYGNVKHQLTMCLVIKSRQTCRKILFTTNYELTTNPIPPLQSRLGEFNSVQSQPISAEPAKTHCTRYFNTLETEYYYTTMAGGSFTSESTVELLKSFALLFYVNSSFTNKVPASVQKFSTHN